MKFCHLFILCLTLGDIFAEDCFKNDVRIKGKLLTRKKTKKNSVEACKSLCEATQGCLGLVYFKAKYPKKNLRKRCLMYKKISKKTKKSSNTISAIMKDCLETTTAATVNVTSGSSQNGEQACEGQNFDATKCASIGCCQFEDGQCWSAVGTATCVSSGTGTGTGGPLDGPSGPTTPGAKCNVKVTFPKKTSPVSKYPMFTTVFGIGVMGSGISDAKFQHIASMLAQLLDNDHDGCPDSPEVVTWLVKQKVVQWFGPGSDTENNRPDGEAIEAAGYTVGGALLFDDEVNPSCAGTLQTNQCSDASLEEIWHVITSQGYEKAFPQIFSSAENSKSTVANAMDVARGGHFTSIPNPYPSSAWYKYDDATCTYRCMAVEYIYWGVASYVGALEGRTDTISEFKFNTKAKLVAGDKLMTALIQDTTKYRLPTVSPDGNYKGCSTCSTGVVHGGN